MAKRIAGSRREARRSGQLQRKKPKRKPYKKILIVCEGEKTEPLYFCEARQYYGLNTVNVQVTGECGSAPKSVVAFAKQSYKDEKASGDPFDEIFCVFDKDGHVDYQAALDSIKSATPKDVFYAINSVPSFEYWLLLHFGYICHPYAKKERKSVGAQVMQELTRPGKLPAYSKGNGGTFIALIDSMEDAIANAKKVLEEGRKNNSDNPSTKVHQLIEVIRTLKEPPEEHPCNDG